MDGVCENKNIEYERKQDTSINAITFAYPAIYLGRLHYRLLIIDGSCFLFSYTFLFLFRLFRLNC